MTDLHSSEVQATRRRAREYVDSHVLPNADAWDAQGQVCGDAIARAFSEGLLGSFGVKPGGMSALEWGYVTAELGRASGSLRTLMTVHDGLVSQSLGRWGSKEQKQTWLSDLRAGTRIAAFGLSEKDSGSDAKSAACHYRTDDGFVLNGEKTWISFGALADVYLIFANGDHGMGCFLVTRNDPGVSVEPTTDMMCLRGSAMATVRFSDCRIDESRLVGRLGTGFDIIANYALDIGRLSVAWGATGLAMGCLEEATRYASSREQFGVPIREHQLVKKLIADMAVSVRAMQRICATASLSRDNKVGDHILEASVAKQFCAKSAAQVASDAVQVLGAQGLKIGSRIERHYRDVKPLAIIEGSNEIQVLMIEEAVSASPRRFLDG